jgi:hypothetical protein
MDTKTVTISIGRGVPGGGDMFADEWDDFRNDVRGVLETFGATVYVDAAQSVGEWEGVAEESATWVAAVPSDCVEWLRGSLGVLRERYQQDAIALTIGETTLVPG